MMRRKWWKEGDRKKKENDVTNVHYAQNQEMKEMQVMSEFVIFCLTVLNGRAYQTRFKSEQSIVGTPGMLVYFIYFCLYYTQKCTDGWSMRN